jgi:DNA processing protein
VDGAGLEPTLDWLILSKVARDATGPWLRAAAAAGSVSALLHADVEHLRVLGLGEGAIAALAARPSRGDAARLAADCRARGVEVATFESEAYPALLRTIDDPPLVLYFRGAAPARIAPAVAVVGSRRASRYGRRTAERVAAGLAEAGFWVVSGMAMGIDAAAHAAALRSGRSAAVLAGGAERASPRIHARLHAQLAEQGCVLSEHPPGTPTRPHHFPIRNRIITGLCVATIVVEAARRSGSLISARLAAEQGRDVLAVPGNIDSPTSVGTNLLLRDGCDAVVDHDQTLAELVRSAARFGPRPQPRAPAQAAADSAESVDLGATADDGARRVLEALDDEPMHVDELAAAAGLAAARVRELLTMLELEGRARRLGAGTYVRTFDLTPR